jgi:hypothetical protein
MVFGMLRFQILKLVCGIDVLINAAGMIEKLSTKSNDY